MTIVKQVGMAVAVLVSGVALAGDNPEVKTISPFTGEEVTGKWFYDASTDGKFHRQGSMKKLPMTVTSTTAGADELAYAIKRIDAAPYRNKRVMATVKFKPTAVEHTVVAWFSAADQEEDQREYLSWDNTWIEPIRGTSDWSSKKMVLQIPAEADYLFVGAGLAGSGKVEVAAVELETVPLSVAVTDKGYISRLYRSGKYEEYLAEMEKVELGEPTSIRYTQLALSKFYALKELGRSKAAGNSLKHISKTIKSKPWQEVNNSNWGKEIAAEVAFLDGSLSEQQYIEAVQEIEFPSTRERNGAMKNLYQTIGFKHRQAGNYAAAKAAYSKAASREWGDKVNYEVVDRRLEEMKQAVLAMDD